MNYGLIVELVLAVPRCHILHIAGEKWGGGDVWNTWQSFNEITEVFFKLSQTPLKEEVTEAVPVLERFKLLMYKQPANCCKENDMKWGW